MDFQKTVIEKFDEMGSAYKKIDAKLDKMDERFDRLTTTVDAHTELLGDLKQTQDRIIAKVVVMDETLTIVQNDVSGLKKDVSRLNDSVDGFAKRQLKFESEVAATHSRLDRLERKPEPA